MARVSIKIFGRVQGVCFRDFVYKHAIKLNLAGWVKNADDGTVEAVFEGDEEDLKKMIGLCRQGPSFSKVDKIDERWEEVVGEFREFVIKY
ncbi:acylphosphatase [Candidatus Parcubacteria bacterium]|nr:acylphosphatase [Candidatus Parcubacteria bacterium]